MDRASVHALDLEESGSCESGWTMYIASSMYDDHEDTQGCARTTYGDDTDQINKYNDGDDSDDSSMASDASSRPRYREQSNDENAEAKYLVDYMNENISSSTKPKIMDKKNGKEGIINADLVKEASSRTAAQRNEAESNHGRGHVADTILRLFF